MLKLFQQRAAIYPVAIFFSLIFSLWSYFKTAVINPDAICYLQSAETMKSGLNAAMHLCDQAKWPLFSGLIYFLSQLTHLSSLQAAYLLDGFLSCISVVTFIAILQTLKSPTRILWLAALVILCAHEFNSLRADVIRDHGYWAFYLVSIFLLLKFIQDPRWRTALAWSISLIVATLFRIEGLIFLVLLPCVALFNFDNKIRSFLKLNSLLLLLCILLAILLLQHSASQLGRVDEVKFQLLNGLHLVANNFDLKAQALAQHVLSVYSAGDAKLILILLLLSWYVFSVAANLSFIYAILVVYAWCKKILVAPKQQHHVLCAYVLINVLITFIFMLENMFLSKRYLLALSLTLMLWVPFALDELIRQWQQRKWPLVLALIFILVSGVGGIVNFGYSKNYIREAGDWLAINVPQKASLYSNDYQLMYYSKHFGNTIFAKAIEFQNPVSQKNWHNYDYVALRINKNAKMQNEIQATPVQIFKNKRGDQVSIYQISERSKL